MVRFVLSEGKRARAGQDSADRPSARLSPGVIALAALDEWTVAVMKTPGRMPTADGYERAYAEILAAHELYTRRGWLDDPASFHRAPPPLEGLTVRRSKVPGIPFEHVTFPSAYEPDPDDPGGARWLSHGPNATAHAWVLRHQDATRPWVVCLHPFGMGYPQLDLRAFRAMWLHRALGCNVVMPVAPLHGPRRVGRLSGAAFMTYNLIDIVNGFGQAVWDVRRVLGWIRAQGGTTIALYGASMGAHIAGMVSGLDPDIACVVSAFPTTDLVELFLEHGPGSLRRKADQANLVGEDAKQVARLATPLALPALVPTDRLFIAAGLADRMATPAQALALWEHWGRPRIEWFNSNHVAFLWSGRVTGFVREALHKTGVA
jgi:hypothetical protein